MKHLKKKIQNVQWILSVARVTIKSAIFAMYDTFECFVLYSCFCVHNARPRLLLPCQYRSIDGLFKYTDNGQRKGLDSRFIITFFFFFMCFVFYIGDALFDLYRQVGEGGYADHSTPLTRKSHFPLTNYIKWLRLSRLE